MPSLQIICPHYHPSTCIQKTLIIGLLFSGFEKYKRLMFCCYSVAAFDISSIESWYNSAKSPCYLYILKVDVTETMQLYHHPYSLNSQRVRLALEEKVIDYTSYHVNPITGKNMDASFFRMNPSAKLPVFQNGAHIIFITIEIIQYVSSFA